MSKHLGDYDAAVTIYGKFTTFRPSTGAPFTLAGSPALSVYKDNSTTQSTSGVTLTVDFDSVTGLHHFAIDLSSDGTFYAAGSFFDIVITTGTIDSVSAVGACVASFTIRKSSSLKPTTAARTLDVSTGGEAGVDWANVGSPTTTNNLSGTSIATSQVVASVTGAVGSVTGAVGSVTGLTASNLDATVSSRLASASYTAPPTANQNADALLDRSNGIETGYTPRQSMRLMLSSAAAKLSGAATTTIAIRDVTDTKDRITATVDASGNRTAVTFDVS